MKQCIPGIVASPVIREMVEGQESGLVPSGGPYCYLYTCSGVDPICTSFLRHPELLVTQPVQIPLGCPGRVAGTLPGGMSHQLAASRVSSRRWAGSAACSPPWQVSSWKTTQLVSGVDHSVPDWNWTGTSLGSRGCLVPGFWGSMPPGPHVISFSHRLKH